jgi:hypothetical protein
VQECFGGVGLSDHLLILAGQFVGDGLLNGDPETPLSAH